MKNKISFEPFWDYVVIQPTSYPKEINGIIVDTSNVEKTPKGVVISAGDLKKYVEEGMEVLHRKFNESPLSLPEGDFIILREENIYGRLE